MEPKDKESMQHKTETDDSRQASNAGPSSPTRDLDGQSSQSFSPRSPTGRMPHLGLSETPRASNLPRKASSARSSWPASYHTRPASPGPHDRVFPIRSVISVDPTQTPFATPSRSLEYNGFPGMSEELVAGNDTVEARQQRRPRSRTASTQNNFSLSTSPRQTQESTGPQESSSLGIDVRNEILKQTSRQGNDGNKAPAASIPSQRRDMSYGGGSRMQIFSDATSDGSGVPSTPESSDKASLTSSHISSGDHEGTGGLVTARFKHIVSTDGHAVITGRDGETLQRCEDEPIHIPGAVQGFGLLIAMREESDGQLVVRIVSENSKKMIGYNPDELFRLSSFTDILSEDQAENLLDHVDFIRDEESDPVVNGPEVFTISIKPPKKHRSVKFWCAMHINPNNPDTLICELELDDDQTYPLVPQNEDSPEPAEDTLSSNPTEEELAESTKAMSKPLRVLRSARKRKGEAAAMEVFNIMSQVQEQLASAPNLDQFLKILVGVVKELTGFHRVMIYQFDSAFNGRVVTELVDPRATKDLYKGLNFPASDIPKQARDLYKINKVRLLYDRDLTTARLVCRTMEDLDKPLDLSFSYLRAMSPIHIKYLANMAVRSSMSISINAFDELWGLISCHGYGSKGMRVSFPIRKMCRLVGDTASRNIERLSYASRLQARKLINTIPTEANPSGYIIASSDDLLRLFDADYGLLSIKGETKILGKLEQSQEVLAMLEYLRLRKMTAVVTSQDLKGDFPDLIYSPGFTVIAGLLLVPLTAHGSDFIVFFRKGQIKEVKWAGNPYEKFVREGTEGYLEPRKSFKTWSEKVIGKCRDWTEEQVETAAVLCLVYGKFIEVWRQKEAALQSSQLTRILLANSAHEVRTPLNAIINYLEIALEGALDQETRDNLAKSHSASKSLIYVINDLLDLTKAEEGQDLVKREIFDLPSTVREAADQFRGDAKRKDIEYEITVHPGIPQYVHGDQRKVRQAVSNLTANAMQHTTVGSVGVELFLVSLEEQRITVDIVVSDTGAGMSDKQLDALFRDLEQVSSEGDEMLSDIDDKENKAVTPVSPERRTLGLGLAIVSRVVRNMNGQLRLKSEEGAGSRFVVQLSFQIYEDEIGVSASQSVQSARLSSVGSSAHFPPPVADGEVVLVNSACSTKADSLTKRKSIDDIKSLSSFKSESSIRTRGSQKSDMDRLIDAISEPLAVGRIESEDLRLARTSSKDSVNSMGTTASFSRVGSAKVESPSHLKRARSHGSSSVPEHLRSSHKGPSGLEYVADNKTPLRAVRMPEGFEDQPAGKEDLHSSYRLSCDPSGKEDPTRNIGEPRKQTADHLQVLVAEDDPVNSKIVIKRMEKGGHQVYHTVNGEECASAYGENPALFDVVLMDMQMPIVDGLTSTKMIRSFEKSHKQNYLSPRARENGRVPIFAVSASLVEREKQTYVNAGFDGWILKPIDFKRLNVLLSGIVDERVRSECLYRPGEWERGGWFDNRQSDIFEADTTPSGATPVSNPSETEPRQPDDDSESGSSGMKTPIQETRRPLIHGERLDAEEYNSGTTSLPAEDRIMEDVTD